MKDRREYVRIAVDLPENPKLVDAHVAAKWLYVVALCYSGQHLTDGHVPQKIVMKTAQVRPQFVAELVTLDVFHEPGHECKDCDQPRPGWIIIHDYLNHQRSRSDADVARRAGKAGAAARWGAIRNANGNANRNADRISGSHANSNAIPNAEVEVEVEVEVEGVTGSQSTLGSSAHERRLDLDKIATDLGQSKAWAGRVAKDILSRAGAVVDPTAYVRAAIRGEPNRYQPTSGPPPVGRICDHGRDRLTCIDCNQDQP